VRRSVALVVRWLTRFQAIENSGDESEEAAKEKESRMTTNKVKDQKNFSLHEDLTPAR
jgi:hypothetical protein